MAPRKGDTGTIRRRSGPAAVTTTTNSKDDNSEENNRVKQAEEEALKLSERCALLQAKYDELVEQKEKDDAEHTNVTLHLAAGSSAQVSTLGTDYLTNPNVEIVQKQLNAGKKASLGTFIDTVLFKQVKFMNKETIEGHPEIIQHAMEEMGGMESEIEKAQFREATIKELRLKLSQKRAYSKKQVMLKYKGES